MVIYVEKENAQLIVNSLKQGYNINEDWMGSLYCGINVD